MLWVAMLSAEVVNVAVREFPVPLSVPVLSVEAPSRKVTIPVGLIPLTVAVKVTLWPMVEGLALLTTDVDVAATLITWLRALDVLVLLPVSPA